MVASLLAVQKESHSSHSCVQDEVEALMMNLFHTQLRLVSSRNTKVEKALLQPLYNILLSFMQKIRYLRKCPVPFCQSKPQRRFANHIKYVHPHLDVGAHRVYLASAQRTPKPAVTTKLLKGQRTLDQVYSLLNPDSGARLEEEEEEPTFTAMSQEGRREMRDFPQFSLDTVQMRREMRDFPDLALTRYK